MEQQKEYSNPFEGASEYVRKLSLPECNDCWLNCSDECDIFRIRLAMFEALESKCIREPIRGCFSNGNIYYKCPVCSIPIENPGTPMQPRYCKNCGQRLR